MVVTFTIAVEIAVAITIVDTFVGGIVVEITNLVMIMVTGLSIATILFMIAVVSMLSASPLLP